jgi:hypothetical protein
MLDAKPTVEGLEALNSGFLGMECMVWMQWKAVFIQDVDVTVPRARRSHVMIRLIRGHYNEVLADEYV